MTNEDLVLAFMATGRNRPAWTEWPVNVPEDLLSFEFAETAGMAVVAGIRASISPPKGPVSALLMAAGLASGAHGVYEAIDENNKEHSDYWIFVEMIYRYNHESLGPDFQAVMAIRREFRGDADNPGDGSSAPSHKD